MGTIAGILQGYSDRVYQRNLLDTQRRISRNDLMAASLEKIINNDTLPEDFRNQVMQFHLTLRQREPGKKFTPAEEAQYNDIMTAFSTGKGQEEEAARKQYEQQSQQYFRDMDKARQQIIAQPTPAPPDISSIIPSNVTAQPVAPVPIPELPVPPDASSGPIPSQESVWERNKRQAIGTAEGVAEAKQRIESKFAEEERERLRSDPTFQALSPREQIMAMERISLPAPRVPSLAHLGAPTQFVDKASGETMKGVPDKVRGGYWVDDQLYPFSQTTDVPSKAGGETEFIREGINAARQEAKERGEVLTKKQEQATRKKLRQEWATAGRDPTSSAINAASLAAIRRMQIHPSQIGPADRLRGDFTKETKDFIQRRGSYATLQALSKEHTPGSDLGTVFAFMKMLDPPSVVREGEQALAKRAASMRSRAEHMASNWWEGRQLTPEQRADFLRQAREMYRAFEQYNNRTMKYYTRRAEMLGVPADYVVSEQSLIEGSEGGATHRYDPATGSVEAIP